MSGSKVEGSSAPVLRRDPSEVLSVSRDSSDQEIKTAYRKLVLSSILSNSLLFLIDAYTESKISSIDMGAAVVCMVYSPASGHTVIAILEATADVLWRPGKLYGDHVNSMVTRKVRDLSGLSSSPSPRRRRRHCLRPQARRKRGRSLEWP
ncbi:hypothetical protein AgCh_032816 [Apium graveolens]